MLVQGGWGHLEVGEAQLRCALYAPAQELSLELALARGANQPHLPRSKQTEQAVR